MQPKATLIEVTHVQACNPNQHQWQSYILQSSLHSSYIYFVHSFFVSIYCRSCCCSETNSTKKSFRLMGRQCKMSKWWTTNLNLFDNLVRRGFFLTSCGHTTPFTVHSEFCDIVIVSTAVPHNVYLQQFHTTCIYSSFMQHVLFD